MVRKKDEDMEIQKNQIKLFLPLEYSKQLVNLGIKIDTLFYHLPNIESDKKDGEYVEYLLKPGTDYNGKDFACIRSRFIEGKYSMTYPAPTWDEFFEWCEKEREIAVQMVKRFTGKWSFYIHIWNREEGIWKTEGNTLSWKDKHTAQFMAYLNKYLNLT